MKTCENLDELIDLINKTAKREFGYYNDIFTGNKVYGVVSVKLNVSYNKSDDYVLSVDRNKGVQIINTVDSSKTIKYSHTSNGRYLQLTLFSQPITLHKLFQILFQIMGTMNHTVVRRGVAMHDGSFYSNIPVDESCYDITYYESINNGKNSYHGTFVYENMLEYILVRYEDICELNKLGLVDSVQISDVIQTKIDRLNEYHNMKKWDSNIKSVLEYDDILHLKNYLNSNIYPMYIVPTIKDIINEFNIVKNMNCDKVIHYYRTVRQLPEWFKIDFREYAI